MLALCRGFSLQNNRHANMSRNMSRDIEGSGEAGPRRQQQKMSNKGVDVNVVQQEGRSTCWDK
jgi:hypothetical protein